MRILIATPLYPPDIGGPATHTLMLEKGLSEHNVETVTLSFGEVRKLPKIFRHAVYFFKCWRRARSADLVFAQDPFSCGLPALIAARAAGVPFVVRIPGDYAWEQAREKHGVKDNVEEFQHNKYKLSLEMLRAVEKFVVRHAEATVAPSKFIGALVECWGPRTLQIVHNGVDEPKDVVMPARAPEPPFIVTASRLIRGKGFECLIDLMAEMPRWKLVIVGGGPLEKELKERATRSPAASRIIFTGAQSHPEMFGWYKAGDVFVLNTEFETFSFQVAEAIAAGAPTIATAVGGIPEIVENGIQGILVTPNDKKKLKEAIESVLEDPTTWKKRKEAGLRRVQELSGAKSVAAFAKLFKEICHR